ncbi:MAG: MarR family winged helix-turn-helix transcriptional regulator [Nannocystaceae bacterium]|nr:MarR family winged helix-turn-helix transcriptional regulator [Nannocystaceae bacterium]
MSLDEHVRRIQRAYPLIWYHCHTQHGGRGSELSERESAVLSHLRDAHPMAPAELAAHLGIGASTLSEAVDKLVERGMVERIVDAADRRRVHYRRTASGEEAIDRSSVLSAASLRLALERMSVAEREQAIAGLERIASACVPTTGEGGAT